MRFIDRMPCRFSRVAVLSFVLRLSLGLVFVYAGWIKLRQPWYVLAGMIDNYGMVAPSISEIIARVLPGAELVLGLALVSGLYRKLSSSVAAAILTFFFLMMLQAYVRGLKIDCGCFGPGQALGIPTLLRDGALVLASLVLGWLCWRPRSATAPDLASPNAS